MDAIRTYFLSVVAAAILCGILKGLLGGKTGPGKLLHLICGIFMTIVAIRPITLLNLDSVISFRFYDEAQVTLAVAEGKNLASDAMEEIIKAQCEAYIQDKAQSLGLTVAVEVELTEDEIPVPRSIRIHGIASPYGKKQLTAILKDQLGIAEEDQIWTG